MGIYTKLLATQFLSLLLFWKLPLQILLACTLPSLWTVASIVATSVVPCLPYKVGRCFHSFHVSKNGAGNQLTSRLNFWKLILGSTAFSSIGICVAIIETCFLRYKRVCSLSYQPDVSQVSSRKLGRPVSQLLL